MGASDRFIRRVRDIMRADEGVTGDAQCMEQLVWMLFLKAYDMKEGTWEKAPGFVSAIPEDLRWRNWAPSSIGLTGDTLVGFIEEELLPDIVSLCSGQDGSPRHRILANAMGDVRNYIRNGAVARKVIDEIEGLELDEGGILGDIYESMLSEMRSQGRAGEYYTPRPLTDFIVEAVDPSPGEKVADLACGSGGFLASALRHMRAKDPCFDASGRLVGVDKMQLPCTLCIMSMLLQGVEEPLVRHSNSLEEFGAGDRYDVILMNPPYGGKELDRIRRLYPKEMRSSETSDLFVVRVMEALERGGRAAVILPDGFLFGTGVKKAIKRTLLERFDLHTVVHLPASTFHPYTSVETSILFFDNVGPTEATWFYRMDLPPGVKAFTYSRPLTRECLEPVLEWYRDRREIRDGRGFKARRLGIGEIESRGYRLDVCRSVDEAADHRSPLEIIQEYSRKHEELEREKAAVLQELMAELGKGCDDSRAAHAVHAPGSGPWRAFDV